MEEKLGTNTQKLTNLSGYYIRVRKEENAVCTILEANLKLFQESKWIRCQWLVQEDEDRELIIPHGFSTDFLKSWHNTHIKNDTTIP